MDVVQLVGTVAPPMIESICHLVAKMIFRSPVESISHMPGWLSVAHHPSSVVCRPCTALLPEIIKVSNPYLVQIFIMFLVCAS